MFCEEHKEINDFYFSKKGVWDPGGFPVPSSWALCNNMNFFQFFATWGKEARGKSTKETESQKEFILRSKQPNQFKWTAI